MPINSVMTLTQYFKTFCAGKPRPAESWFHSRRASLSPCQLPPNKALNRMRKRRAPGSSVVRRQEPQGMGKAIRDALEDWPTVDASLPKPERGLLLGNGASIALWPKFRYDSLFVVAQDVSKPEHLHEQDVAVFSALETKNFEAVLSALITAGRVWGIYKKPKEDIDDLRATYRRVRTSLVRSVAWSCPAGLRPPVLRFSHPSTWGRQVECPGHPTKAGTVTVSGKPGVDMPLGTLNSALNQAGLKQGCPMRYLVVIEQGPRSFGAYVPDLPGCVAAAATAQEVLQLIHETIEFHVEGLKENGAAVPQPHSYSEFVEVHA